MRRFFSLVLVFFIFTQAAWSQAHDVKVTSALKLVDLGNPKEAADQLRQMIAAEPKNAEAHAGLAIALLDLNQTQDALTEAQAGFDIDRHDALVRVARGEVYGKQGKVDDALDEFHQAIKIDPKDVGSMVALSRYYISIDSLKSAEITLYQAQALDAKDIRSYLGLAALYERQHIPDLAIGQYEQAMKLDPNDLRVHAELAGLYLRRYKYNESAKEWLKVIQIDTTYADAYYQIANLYFLAKQYPNSATYADRYVKLRPNDIKGQWLYAQALVEAGDYKNALPALQAVSSNDSLKALSQNLLARSYFYSKDYAKALDVYKNSQKLGPKDLEFYGEALLLSGVDTAQAIDKMQQSLVGDTVRTAQEKLQTESVIGNLLYQQKKYEDAAKVFAQMADQNPSVESYLSAGQVYDFAKKPEEANTYYNKALALNPHSLKVLMQMSIGAETAGAGSDTALETFQKFKDAADAAQSKDTAAIADGFIGFHYFADKDWKKSVEHTEPAVKSLEASNTQYLPSFESILAAAYVQEQDLPKAKIYYEKLLKLQPQNEDAKKGLEYINANEGASKKHK
ncbi:MAG TPA: tetratricopeptide repeat protein [Candidatus Kapabacteria bacterium]